MGALRGPGRGPCQNISNLWETTLDGNLVGRELEDIARGELGRNTSKKVHGGYVTAVNSIHESVPAEVVGNPGLERYEKPDSIWPASLSSKHQGRFAACSNETMLL